MPDSSALFTDGYWWSTDGLRLHMRDYAPIAEGGTEALRTETILCLHGLTRNARDFETLAPWLAARGYRVLCPDMRGRGESAYAKDSMSYTPLTYVQDVEGLIAETGAGPLILIGTSMGGIMAMLMAAQRPERVAGVVLNDIGPDLSADGLKRIVAGISGQGRSHETWMHAARYVAEQGRDIHPSWSLNQWLVYAKRTHKLTSSGKIMLDYDSKIAEPLRLPGGATGVDLWAAMAALKDISTLIVRGADSDLLSPETMQRMLDGLTKGTGVTVPDVGHAPTLDEPLARDAIAAFLDSLERAG